MTYTNSQKRSIITGSALLIVAVVAMALTPLFASAASYAYVDVTGTVRAVTADNWQTAISVAPNIHPRSGVKLLESARDLGLVGDTI